MGKASKIVTLALIGSGVGIVGYNALSDDEGYDGYDSTTGPSGSRYHGSSGYYRSGSSGSSSSGSSYHSSSSSSRGGFGSTGHSSSSSS